MLDDLQEGRLVVEIRLEIGGVDRDQTLSGRGDFIHRSARLGERAQYRQGFGGGRTCLPRRVHRLRGVARVRELRKSASCVAFPGSVHERCPSAPAFIGRLRDLSQGVQGGVSSRSRFGVRIRTQSTEMAAQFAFPLSCRRETTVHVAARRPAWPSPVATGATLWSDLVGQSRGDTCVLSWPEGFQPVLLGIRQRQGIDEGRQRLSVD